MRTELPFEITPQIRRFLDELTFSDEFDSGDSLNLIQIFDIGERLSESSFENVKSFLKYLEAERFVKVDTLPKIVKTNDGKAVRPKVLKIKILENESLQELFDFFQERQRAKPKNLKTHWNPATRTLSYRDIKPYTIQSKERLALFEPLWRNKKHIMAGETHRVGKPINARVLAARLGITQDRREHGYNDGGIQAVGDKAKYLGTYLKDTKGFPITITTHGGIQMILDE